MNSLFEEIDIWALHPLQRALESQKLMVNSLFEVPVLPPRMRGLCGVSTFLMVFKNSLFL